MKLIAATIAADKLSMAYSIQLAELVDTFAEIPTVDAVPISELLTLRDELYEKDQITMCGLEKMNQLIAAYNSQLEEREHPINSASMNQEERWLKTI